MRATRLVAVGLLAAAAGGCASGSKAVSSTDAARVRVVNDASQVQGCQVLGTVADNDFEDLQRKAAKVGGNVALMTPERKAKKLNKSWKEIERGEMPMWFYLPLHPSARLSPADRNILRDWMLGSK